MSSSTPVSDDGRRSSSILSVDIPRSKFASVRASGMVAAGHSNNGSRCCTPTHVRQTSSTAPTVGSHGIVSFGSPDLQVVEEDDAARRATGLGTNLPPSAGTSHESPPASGARTHASTTSAARTTAASASSPGATGGMASSTTSIVTTGRAPSLATYGERNSSLAPSESGLNTRLTRQSLNSIRSVTFDESSRSAASPPSAAGTSGTEYGQLLVQLATIVERLQRLDAGNSTAVGSKPHHQSHPRAQSVLGEVRRTASRGVSFVPPSPPRQQSLPGQTGRAIRLADGPGTSEATDSQHHHQQSGWDDAEHRPLPPAAPSFHKSVRSGMADDAGGGAKPDVGRRRMTLHNPFDPGAVFRDQHHRPSGGDTSATDDFDLSISQRRHAASFEPDAPFARTPSGSSFGRGGGTTTGAAGKDSGAAAGKGGAAVVQQQGTGAAKRIRRGLAETSPLVSACDVVYLVATVAHWCVCVSALTAPDNSHDSVFIAIIAVCQLLSIGWTASRFAVQRRDGDWDILVTVEDIAKHYRKTWFPFDALCAIPFEFFLIGWANPVFFWFQLRQLVRAARFVTLGHSSNPLREARLWVQMLVSFLVILFVVHAAAAVFSLIEGYSYMTGLYWATTTITSVGYGDIVSKDTPKARGFAVGIMLLGVAMLAGMTAFATSFLTSRDALEQDAREKKRMLASMLEYYQVPWEAQIEIISLFPTALAAENSTKFQAMMENMPAVVVDKISDYTRAKALATAIPLFESLPVDVVLDVATKLNHRFAHANDCVIQYGDDGHDMFFLVRGVADVVQPINDTDEVVVAVLRSGTFFGEMALVQDVVRSASVVCVVTCELLVLGKADFKTLVRKHRSLHDLFLRVVFARHNVSSLERSHNASVLSTSEIPPLGPPATTHHLLEGATASSSVKWMVTSPGGGLRGGAASGRGALDASALSGSSLGDGDVLQTDVPESPMVAVMMDPSLGPNHSSSSGPATTASTALPARELGTTKPRSMPTIQFDRASSTDENDHGDVSISGPSSPVRSIAHTAVPDEEENSVRGPRQFPSPGLLLSPGVNTDRKPSASANLDDFYAELRAMNT